MWHTLLRVIVVLSLFISLVGACIWIRGWFVDDHFEWRWAEPFRNNGGSGYRGHVLALEVGHSIRIEHGANWQSNGSSLAAWHTSAKALPNKPAPFRFSTRPHPSGLDWVVQFPAWAAIAPAIVPLAAKVDARLRRARSRRMIKAQLCPACGYDLRASKDRCPECGRPISS